MNDENFCPVLGCASAKANGEAACRNHVCRKQGCRSPVADQDSPHCIQHYLARVSVMINDGALDALTTFQKTGFDQRIEASSSNENLQYAAFTKSSSSQHPVPVKNQQHLQQHRYGGGSDFRQNGGRGGVMTRSASFHPPASSQQQMYGASCVPAPRQCSATQVSGTSSKPGSFYTAEHPFQVPCIEKGCSAAVMEGSDKCHRHSVAISIAKRSSPTAKASNHHSAWISPSGSFAVDPRQQQQNPATSAFNKFQKFNSFDCSSARVQQPSQNFTPSGNHVRGNIHSNTTSFQAPQQNRQQFRSSASASNSNCYYQSPSIQQQHQSMRNQQVYASEGQHSQGYAQPFCRKDEVVVIGGGPEEKATIEYQSFSGLNTTAQQPSRASEAQQFRNFDNGGGHHGGHHQSGGGNKNYYYAS